MRLISKIFISAFAVMPYTMSGQTTFADSIPSFWDCSGQQYQTLPAEDNWWSEFNDPILTKLISRGVDKNFNVAVAARRIETARQSIRQARSGYYPQIGIEAGWTGSRTSGNMTRYREKATSMNYISAGVDVSWEIDLFGRIRQQVKASKANYQATRAEYLAAMNSLSAEIALTYIELRTWQSQLDVANKHLNSQQKVLKITEARHEAGLVSKLDVAQASTIYNSTAATIPSLETNIATAINALSVLIGEYPGQLDSMLQSATAIPDYRRIVAIGVPADLLRRRPDLQAAEMEMAYAAANVGIAKKDFLPTLTIEGQVGVASHHPSDLFDKQSLTYQIAPKLSWTVFDGFARNATLATARENMQIAIDNYNETLLTAMQEASNALTGYCGQLRTIQSFESVVKQAQEELALSLDLYKQGLGDFLSVAQAQITYLQYADQLEAAKGTAASDLVDIYKALGGGWSLESK